MGTLAVFFFLVQDLPLSEPELKWNRCLSESWYYTFLHLKEKGSTLHLYVVYAMWLLLKREPVKRSPAFTSIKTQNCHPELRNVLTALSHFSWNATFSAGVWGTATAHRCFLPWLCGDRCPGGPLTLCMQRGQSPRGWGVSLSGIWTCTGLYIYFCNVAPHFLPWKVVLKEDQETPHKVPAGCSKSRMLCRRVHLSRERQAGQADSPGESIGGKEGSRPVRGSKEQDEA